MRSTMVLLLISISIAVSAQTDHSIKSIYFEGGSFNMDDYQVQSVIDFLDSIPNIEQYRITIHSYTDNIGGAYYNEWLSGKRSSKAYN